MVSHLSRFLVIKLVRDIVGPFIFVALTILLKRCVLGRFRAGPRTHSQWELIRYYLVETLVTKSWQFEEVCSRLVLAAMPNCHLWCPSYAGRHPCGESTCMKSEADTRLGCWFSREHVWREGAGTEEKQSC